MSDGHTGDDSGYITALIEALRTNTLLAEAATALAALQADAARYRDALRNWESFGCPICGGDCSAANPPVTDCPIKRSRAAIDEAMK